MKESTKGFSLVVLALIIVVVGILLAVGLYVASKNGVTGKPGVNIEVITGAGGMPPDTSPGTPLEGEQFTVVFTEPFPSLENWQAAKVVNEISTNTGKATLDLPTGKYGVYYIYKGQKTLYSDLTLENPRNNIQRDKQGPWYIKVNSLQRTKLRFSVNPLPS